MGQSRISSPVESKYTHHRHHHQEASIVGALGCSEVSGCLMLGLKVAKTVTVYDDEHACVEVKTEDVAEPLVVVTN